MRRGKAHGTNRVRSSFRSQEERLKHARESATEASVELVTELRSFALLREEWGVLLRDTLDANVFLSHEWLYSWWVAYGKSTRIRIVVVRSQGRAVAIAPMMCGVERHTGIPVRVLRFIGDGSWETDHMNFLVHRDAAEWALASLLTAIERLPWDIAFINQLPETAFAFPQVRSWALRKGWETKVEAVSCPRAILPDSSEALMARLPPRFRTSLRSSRRRLDQAYSVEFGEHDSAEDLPKSLDALFRNHSTRWAAKGERGVFQSEDKKNFYRELSPRLLQRGWLRFYYLKLDGAIVAQEYCFALGDTVMLLQEGFDYSFAKLNVGNTLRGLVMERLIERGVKVYDFLAGTSRHKQTWSNDATNDLRISIVRPTVRGRLLVFVARVKAVMRRTGRPLAAQAQAGAAVEGIAPQPHAGS